MGSFIEIMDSDFSSLRKIYNYFTMNDYFIVFSLITHESDWIGIDINDRNIKKIKLEKEKHFFSLIMKDNGTTLGYLNILNLNDDKIKKLEKLNEHTLPF